MLVESSHEEDDDNDDDDILGVEVRAEAKDVLQFEDENSHTSPDLKIAGGINTGMENGDAAAFCNVLTEQETLIFDLLSMMEPSAVHRMHSSRDMLRGTKCYGVP